jgi:DNA polymerase III delta subunit
MRPEQAEIALQSARKTSRERLLEGLKALQKADDRLKSGGDERVVLEFLVAGLAGSAG